MNEGYKIIKGIATKINNNPFVVLLATICTIISTVVTLIYDNFFLRLICTVFILLYLGIIITRAFTYAELRRKANTNLTEVYEMIKSFNFQIRKSFDDIQDEDVGTYRHLDNLLKPLSEYICHFSELIIGEKSSICIKMIEADSLMNEDVEKWRLKTIARSSSTDAKRLLTDDRPVFVSRNSDFSIIIQGTDPIHSNQFIVPDLPKLIDTWREEGREYHNSTKKYLSKYKSTIVIPIKTETQLVSEHIKNQINNSNNSHYHIIGFLCWDSKKTFSKDNEYFIELAELLESFASVLYPLLENYLILLITKGKNAETN